MKTFCLLLCMTSFTNGRYFTSRPLHRASTAAAGLHNVRYDAYSSAFKLRGGESDPNRSPDKRRKKKRRRSTNESNALPEIDASSADDAHTPEISNANDVSKKRQRRRDFVSNMFKGKAGRQSDVPVVVEEVETSIAADVAGAKKRKKRKRRAVTTEQSAAEESPDDANVDASLGEEMINKDTEKKGKRRKKRRSDVKLAKTDLEADERDSTKDDEMLTLEEQVHDKASTGKKKRRRHKKVSEPAADESLVDAHSVQDDGFSIQSTDDGKSIVDTSMFLGAESVESDVPSKKKRKRKKRKTSSESATAGDGSVDIASKDEVSDSVMAGTAETENKTGKSSAETATAVGGSAFIALKDEVSDTVMDDTADKESKTEDEEETVPNKGLDESPVMTMDAAIELQKVILESDSLTDESADIVASSEAQTSTSFEDTPQTIVSIDATIEIHDEEIVPESMYSAVEVDDSVAAVEDEEPIEPEEASRDVSVKVELSDVDEAVESEAAPTDETVEYNENGLEIPIEKSVLGEVTESTKSEAANTMPLQATSVEATNEIPVEEAVPEIVFSTMETGDSVYDVKTKDADSVITCSVDAEVDLSLNEVHDIEAHRTNADVVADEDPNDEGDEDDDDEEEAMNAIHIAGATNIDEKVGMDVETDLQDEDTAKEHPPDKSAATSLCSEEDAEDSSIPSNDTSDETPDSTAVAYAEIDSIEHNVFERKTAEETRSHETVEKTNTVDKDCLTLSVVTWNLGEAAPSEKEASFIRQFRKGSDLVMIGAQECEDIKPRRSEGHRSRHLRRLGIQMLGEQYVPIAIHSLGGIQMALYCRREKLDYVEFIGLADVTCGVGNVFHNKGAIGVYLKLKHLASDSDSIKSSKLLLVTGHLAAHVKNADARNMDYMRIMTELEMQAPARFLRPKKNRDGSPVQGDGSYLLNSMDHIIFSGDLNYRIDLPREYVDRCIDEIKQCQSGEMSDEKQSDALMNKLLRRDQLLRTISSGRAFTNFNEGKIAFLPTFKFDKGSPEYDTSYKQRIPAWTDRILFKSNSIQVLEYDSVPDAMHSDHRPVYGTFSLGWGGAGATNEKKTKRKSSRR